MGKLTTHVLDTAHGRAGAGMRVALHALDGHGARACLVEFVTNADGRCDAPLLEGDALKPGIYELAFAVGDYFADLGVALPTPRFLDTVVLRVGIADANAHYHVPLLCSPWSYSTYRGS